MHVHHFQRKLYFVQEKTPLGSEQHFSFKYIILFWLHFVCVCETVAISNPKKTRFLYIIYFLMVDSHNVKMPEARFSTVVMH